MSQHWRGYFSAVYTGPRQLAVWESGGSFGKWKICIDITIHMGFNEICFQALEFEFSGILQNLSHSTTDFGYVETQRNEMFIFPILRWEKIFGIHKL